jgi:hypothetical protein
MGIAIHNSRRSLFVWQAGVNYDKGGKAVAGSCCIGENVRCNLQKNALKLKKTGGGIMISVHLSVSLRRLQYGRSKPG